jgi:hypothetical protein
MKSEKITIVRISEVRKPVLIFIRNIKTEIIKKIPALFRALNSFSIKLKIKNKKRNVKNITHIISDKIKVILSIQDFFLNKGSRAK